jgi:ABC-type polysaccharide/polyol phosphate export permease
MLNQLKECVDYRDFFLQFVRQQLHQRYQASLLGFLWTLINPLLLFVSFSLIFSVLNRADLKVYGVYFFSGYMTWIFFSTGVTNAAESIIANAGYVTRIHVPNLLFPLAAVAVSLVDLLASFLILAGLMVITGATFSPALAILPISVLFLIIFVCGVGILFAASTVFLRDFRHLLSSILFLWFFFSPILFRLDGLPREARRYFEWNPILPFLRLFQSPISSGVLPDGQDFLRSALLAVGVLALGCFTFVRSEKKFYYYL